MHWGQIKTLLILSFFILDIYLFAQFMDKKAMADVAILEQPASSIEEQLKAENIKVEKLPKEEPEKAFISVKQNAFKEEDLKQALEIRKQDSFILNHTLIASQLDEPMKLEKSATEETLMNILNEIVYFPEEYTFWNWNKEHNIIIYFQNKMDRPVYYNQNGIVLLYLNADNEIEYYTQTMLGDAEAISEKQKLIKPMRAIEELYDGNQLYSGDKINGADIGFHTRMPFESGVQVFAPVWKVNVNGEKNFFVNALEGFTFSTDEEQFLLEVIDSNIEKMKIDSEKDTAIDDMLKDLQKREDGMKDNEVTS